MNSTILRYFRCFLTKTRVICTFLQKNANFFAFYVQIPALHLKINPNPGENN